MIGFIGLGNLGSALFKRMAKIKNLVEKPGEVFYLYDYNSVKLKSLASKKAKVVSSLEEMFAHSQYIFICVKPNDFADLADSIKFRVQSQHVFISVMAGVTLNSIQKKTQATKIVRVMPNTPALVGAGVGGVSFSKEIGSEEKTLILNWLATLGFFFEVGEEKMSAVTALTGSGPAWVFTFIQALADAGVQAGMSRELALKSVIAMVMGSSKLLEKTGKHPYALRDEIASPGGTTIDGLLALSKNGFEKSIHQGVKAAYDKAVEMTKD